MGLSRIPERLLAPLSACRACVSLAQLTQAGFSARGGSLSFVRA